MPLMKSILLPALIVLALAGCAPQILNYAPLADEGGARAFSIVGFYGAGNGTLEEARAVLDAEARRLCGSAFTVSREQTIKRGSIGNTELLWIVRCSVKL